MTLNAEQAITRFKENEDRVDKFVNQTGTYSTNTTPAQQVTTLPSFMAELILRYLAYQLKGNWTTSTAYSPLDVVLQGGFAYVCLVAHTAGTFATDLSAGKWALYQGVKPTELAAAAGADAVGFQQAGTDAILRTLGGKAREIKSFEDFGAKGDGSLTATQQRAAIEKAWTSAMTNDHDLYHPGGVYDIGEYSFPWRQAVYPPTSLLDCKNITIYGSGPNSIFKTTSASGADVLQLNGVKNLHIRNCGVQASLTAFAGAGSNGISITGGWDNLTFENIWVNDLPYVEKTEYLDGGKGFTIQPGTPTTECGSIKARNLFIKGCVHGVGLEVDLNHFMPKKHAIDIEAVLEDCWYAVEFSAGAATAPLQDGDTVGYRVKAQAINCQHDVVLGRAHGVDIECQVITTKTAANRLLNPQGVQWRTGDTVVDALLATYAANSRIVVYGDKKDCTYKAQIGGTSQGSAGPFGPTAGCDIFLDIAGTASVANINAVDFGGNVVSDCTIKVSTTTSTSLPNDLYLPYRNNTLIVGSSQRLMGLLLSGALNFAYTDGKTSYHSIKQLNGELCFQQTIGSSANLFIGSFLSNTGARKFGIRNDGSIATTGMGTATAVASVKGILPIYDGSNNFYGYVPVYNSYTG